METVLMIAATIACLAIAYLSILAISTINSFKELAENAKKNLDSVASDVSLVRSKVNSSLDEITEVKGRLNLLFDEFSDLKKDVSTALVSINSLAGSLENTSENIGNKSIVLFRMLESIEDMTKVIYAKFVLPIERSVGFVSAASKSVKAFSNALFNRTK